MTSLGILIIPVLALSFLLLIFSNDNRIFQQPQTKASATFGALERRRTLRETSSSNEPPRRRSKLRGNATVDFYRTYEEKEVLGMTYKSYSIPRWRLYTQLMLLNFWYNGRVEFLMGDIIDFEDKEGYYNEPFDCFDGALQFSRFDNGFIQDESRVSILYVKRLQGTLYGCVNPTDVPLGGRSGFVPAIIMGMSNLETSSISWTTAGLNNFGGVTVAHEMGHIIGYDHTALRDEESSIGYQFCRLNLRYPQYNSALSLELNEIIWDEVTGEPYDYNDWRGKTNIMSEVILNNFQLVKAFEVGIYENKYGPIFEKILDCWFNRSQTGDLYTNETGAFGGPMGLLQLDP